MENILPTAISVLATTPARWTSLAQSVPAGLLTESPAPGEWSALECLSHLVDTERWIFPLRVRAFLAGEDFPAFNPDTQGTKLADLPVPLVLAETFDRLRKDSLALLAQVRPDDLPRRARHGELGPVTLDQMLHEWAAHDLMHTVQAERALMQPFLRNVGPWLRYFSDHVAKSK